MSRTFKELFVKARLRRSYWYEHGFGYAEAGEMVRCMRGAMSYERLQCAQIVKDEYARFAGTEIGDALLLVFDKIRTREVGESAKCRR